MQTTLYRKHSNRTVFFWPMSRDSVCRLTMNDFSSEENMEPVIFPPRSRKDSNLLFSDGILARNVPFQVFEGSIPTLPGNENFSAWCVFCRGYGCPLIFIIIIFFFPEDNASLRGAEHVNDLWRMRIFEGMKSQNPRIEANQKCQKLFASLNCDRFFSMTYEWIQYLLTLKFI